MSSQPVAVAAVDLGAESGRVMLAEVGPDRLALSEVHRFANRPVRAGGTLHWDVLRLFDQTVTGLRAAANRAGAVHSVGIDSWAVDFGLLDATGALLGNPVHYRDARTEGVMERVVAQLGAEQLYQTTGLQLLPFNTLFQLVAAAGTPQLAAADRLLMIPDLLSYWLCGTLGSELTNASTTQLFDARTRDWAGDLIEAAGLPTHLFPPVRGPGQRLGVLPGELGAGTPALTATGSHDTASAVVGVPLDPARGAYISCGTWSLVGVELPAPVLTDASRLANFTNEAGVDGTYRYLRNVMGLWLLQESLRSWQAAGEPVELAPLLAAAADQPGLVSVVDATDPAFIPPGDLPARIAAACQRTGQPVPAAAPQFTRAILDSLALAHRSVIRQVQQLSGIPVATVHIVGGGARNELLCQLTADACDLPVVAGPVEATAIGNALVQARALGAVDSHLRDMRTLIGRTQQVKRYEPGGDAARWREAAGRIDLEESL